MAEKVAIVTGSNKGIGFGIVKALCEKFSGTVYLTARDESRGKLAVQELNKLDLHPQFHQLDITDDKSVNNFRDYLKEKHGGIDILVNNAAVGYKFDVTDQESANRLQNLIIKENDTGRDTLITNPTIENKVEKKESVYEQSKNIIETNYFGTLRVCNALFPLLRPNARVVNLSSSCGHLCRIPGVVLKTKFKDPNLTVEQLSELMTQFIDSAKRGKIEEEGWGTVEYTPYNVSKVGVSALTFIQQKELDKDSARPGIAVNAVHPGYVITDMTYGTGEWTVEQGIDAPVYLALLPQEGNQIKGCYVWKDRKIIEWDGPEVPLY